ncbi:MAG: hypothetical protein H0W84_10155, partial [Bacteroidetes bacterium]|nr:hypothetical protein [Bacteroidota bacterium]
YYTKDPLYSNLIRTALEIGFTVFPYETTKTLQDSTSIKLEASGINMREIEQAKNIKKILDKDPLAKILIHCGYDHIVETNYPGWGKAMAGRIIEYTGINPFTIDQVKFTELSSLEYENPFFKKINLNYFAFFIDSAGNLFNGPEGLKQYDVRLYHPRTKWKSGRPNWVFENNRAPYFVNDKITVGYPCLVLAYLSNEIKNQKNNPQNVIPFDIIELKSKNDLIALSLKKGNYKIIVQDIKGNTQILETIK